MNKYLVGCGGVLLVSAIFIGVLILETPRFLEAGKTVLKNVLAEETRISGLEMAWQPPTAAPDEQWFPPAVGEWQLEENAPLDSVTAIGLQRPAHRGVYRSPRGRIEVWVAPVAEAERTRVIEAAQDALRARVDVAKLNTNSGVEVSFSRESARVTTTRGNRTHVRMGTSDHTRFWGVKDWLFVFRAYGEADAEEFPELFLTSMPGQRAAEVPAAR